jgi:succinoglycan biosynthesis transport protein ExoP
LSSEYARAKPDRSHEDDEQNRDVLGAVARRAWVVAVFVALTAAAAYFLSGLQEKKYAASSSLLFGASDVALQLIPNASPSGDATRQAETNIRLVLSRTVAARVARRMPPLTPEQVQSRVSASQEGQSDVVSVTATDTSAGRAARLANTYADQFVAFRRESNAANIQAALQRLAAAVTRLERAGLTAQARQLRRQYDNLATLQAVAPTNVGVLDPAKVPGAPSSPKKGRALLLGALAGLLLGVAAAFGLDQLDRRLRRPSDIEATLGLPVLATIPRSLALRNAQVIGLLDPDLASSGDLEAFRALRAKLQYMDISREIRSVVVTSAAPGEGSSTTSMALAVVGAAAGDRVLLVEADWRRPALGRRLSEKGLSHVLEGVDSLEDVLVKVPIARSSGAMRPSSASGEPSLHLDVLPAGPLPANPGELIESARMRELIVDAEERYDLVVIDTPPVSVVADAFALMASVSGVIVVTRLHRVTRDAISSLRSQLSDVSALVLGVVVNGAQRAGHDHRAYLRVGANGAPARPRAHRSRSPTG